MQQKTYNSLCSKKHAINFDAPPGAHIVQGATNDTGKREIASKG